MRKFLCLLTAVTVVSTTTAPLITKILETNIVNNNTIENKYYPPTSFKNFIYNINTSLGADMDFVEKNFEGWSMKLNEFIGVFTGILYKNFINNKQGNVHLLKMIPKEEIMLQNFNNTYINSTSNKQTFQIQEYSRTITNTHSFSVSLTESITNTVSISASFKTPLVDSEIKDELTMGFSDSQEWTETISSSEILTNPSQSFIVNPYSIGRASYIIKQGTYYNEGVIRFPINLSDQILIPIFSNFPASFPESYFHLNNFLEFIIPTLKAGYADQMRMDSNKYSLISLENPENPESGEIYLNLPISWESQGGELEVNFSETAL